MSEVYLRTLDERVPLAPQEREVLAAVNVSADVELLSLLWSFPGLVEVARLRAVRLRQAVAESEEALMAVLAGEGLSLAEPEPHATGAEYPPGVPGEPGSEIGLPEPPAMIAEPSLLSQARGIDKRSALPWPVRDQGHRRTCVAFAMTALREHLEFGISGKLNDLSEQFLYWATKTRTTDPKPKTDGTWIRYCRDALDSHGVCDEKLWPYNGVPLRGNVTQEKVGVRPSRAARRAAMGNRCRAVCYERGPIQNGNAVALLRELQSCRPVAISLPVFRDRARPTSNNWNTPVAALYGKVLDPPPTSIADGGHAVCVTGFEPDPGEPAGGHFVFRNSWGAGWGRRLPKAPYFGPQAGYGQVSATYVDRFLWEMCRL